MKNIIIMALEAEAPNMAKWDNVFFTGVGKVNAAITTAKLLERYPDVENVFNFGTAGGITPELSGVQKIGNFVQRDMQCCPFGVEEGQTPFEVYTKLVFDYEAKTCSTGDNFVTDSNLSISADVVDMEAYAIAKAVLVADCERGDTDEADYIMFHCYKYISDEADESSKDDWHENVANGEEHYINIYNQIKGND